MGFGANGGFDFTKKLKEMLRKKDGVWSERWICFTKDKREFLRKKKGFGANGGFGCKKKIDKSIDFLRGWEEKMVSIFRLRSCGKVGVSLGPNVARSEIYT